MTDIIQRLRLVGVNQVLLGAPPNDVAYLNVGAVCHEAATEIERLREDSERYWWLRDWLVRTGLLTAQHCRIDAPETLGDWWILRQAYTVGGALAGYGKTEDAAIDAALKGDKR